MLNNFVMAYDEAHPVARLPRLPHSVNPLFKLATGRNFDPLVSVPQIVALVRNDACLAVNLCVSLRNLARVPLDTGEPVNLTRILMDMPARFYGELSADPDTRDFDEGRRLQKYFEQITASAIAVSEKVPPIWTDTAYLMLIQSMTPAMQIVVESNLDEASPYLQKYSKFEEMVEANLKFTLDDYAQHVDEKFNMPRYSNPLYPQDVRSVVAEFKQQLNAQLAESPRKKVASA